MRKTLFLFSFLLLSLLQSQAQEKLEWTEEKLTWKDFEAKPNGQSRFLANTNSGFSYTWGFGVQNGKPNFTYEVHSYFYPQQSWVKKGKETPTLLAHEQLHFDISELYARKMRKWLSNYSPKSLNEAKAKLQKLHKQVESERIKMQNAYDKETNHGMISEEQKRWQLKVNEALDILNQFSL
ncbi:DUF922 domain-containing protein [Mesonia sp.]|uniref:DUF922 domain-containing protein n=1 Tax=Mesonia sp. TaxID=1960830 RepID=UPI001766CA85|nr:DUF922 domain-containing protein [Mesonia sp.]HIB37462.1 DUF922 domain-containing protein [Mesonia sp.]HIO26067.1 DUF922 domain-containing protein [Flavobacteriaceae bacterium]